MRRRTIAPDDDSNTEGTIAILMDRYLEGRHERISRLWEEFSELDHGSIPSTGLLRISRRRVIYLTVATARGLVELKVDKDFDLMRTIDRLPGLTVTLCMVRGGAPASSVWEIEAAPEYERPEAEKELEAFGRTLEQLVEAVALSKSEQSIAVPAKRPS